MSDLERWMKEFLPRLEEELKRLVSRADQYNGRLWEAMEYSLMAGGKRLRPVFLVLTGLSLGAEEEQLLPFACALEMIHTYSLIHDDLPAMDNDDYRRGRLTNHKVYGDATAILAGDGLLNLAAETMADRVTKLQEVGTLTKGDLLAMQRILHAAGPSGMIAGQIADIFAEEHTVGEEGLAYIDHNKTGQLLTAAFMAGGYLAGMDRSQEAVLEEAGFEIGTAFQIQDDILDVEGSLEELGKAVGNDAANQKETFVTVFGLEKAKEASRNLSGSAIQKLKILEGPYGGMVRELVLSLVSRVR